MPACPSPGHDRRVLRHLPYSLPGPPGSALPSHAEYVPRAAHFSCPRRGGRWRRAIEDCRCSTTPPSLALFAPTRWAISMYPAARIVLAPAPPASPFRWPQIHRQRDHRICTRFGPSRQFPGGHCTKGDQPGGHVEGGAPAITQTWARNPGNPDRHRCGMPPSRSNQ